MSRVTIETIARASKVSVGTVDRALNGRGRINEETKRNILRIAEEMGYRPNKIASALGRQRKINIAVITPRNPHFFYKYIRLGVLDAESEFADYGLNVEHVLCESLEVEEQMRVLGGFDFTCLDGVAINAGGDALAPQINRIVDSGVPVVTFNSDAKGSKRLVFVGENSYKSGQMSADVMGRFLHGKGKVGVFTSFFHPGSAMDRRNGFCDVIRECYPDIQIVVSETYKDDYEIAFRAFAAAMQRYPDLDGAFSNSATGSLALGDYVANHPLPKKPVLIGYDVTQQVEQYLKQGICDMIIDQEPRRQSYLAVTLLFKHLSQRWMPQSAELEIRSKIVMRFNAADHSIMQAAGDAILL
ncbi:LacI family DNA-binding transcriptional regulator [Bacillota bacterium Meth-B3]|nr:LacI family DNA-binding transcriptional regulator [Christensenellaceae bacterium]MEA5068050.1 LacI family DNA-binding transcriptional regulator [Christensenellaceae bacterium]